MRPVLRLALRTRLWPDLRSCFLRLLRLSEARRRAVVFRLAFFVVRGIAVVYWRLRQLSNGLVPIEKFDNPEGFAYSRLGGSVQRGRWR